MASEVLATISRDEVERARLMSEFKGEMDFRTHVNYAEQKGLERGLEKGLEEGLEKGRQEGLKEILDLLKSGKSPEDIIQEYEE